MQAEELLQTLTDDELKRRANHCFLQAEDTNLYKRPSPEERLRFLTEADFYLKALIWRQDARTAERDRRRNEELAQRDFKMEIGVMVLIGFEIVLSVVGLWMGYQQGKVLDKQTSALTHMDTSTAATAAAMKAASTSLQTLADAQTKSLDRLNQMSSTLSDSLKTSSAMAGATHKQLNILEQGQAARIAELAKKPKLNLYIGHAPLFPAANAPPPFAHHAREETDTSVTFDADLVNEGNASATKPLLRVIVFGADISFQPSTPFSRLLEQPNSLLQTYLIQADTIRPNVDVRMTLTFSFSRAHAPFQVLFNVDADEIQTATPLGFLWLTPRKPANDEQPPHL